MPINQSLAAEIWFQKKSWRKISLKMFPRPQERHCLMLNFNFCQPFIAEFPCYSLRASSPIWASEVSVARFIQSPSCFAACARSPPLPLTDRISIALSVSLQDEQLSSRFCCNLNIQPSSVCCNNSLTVAWDVLNNWTLVKYIWNNSFIERLSMTLKVLIWPWWGGKNCNRT